MNNFDGFSLLRVLFNLLVQSVVELIIFDILRLISQYLLFVVFYIASLISVWAHMNHRLTEVVLVGKSSSLRGCIYDWWCVGLNEPKARFLVKNIQFRASRGNSLDKSRLKVLVVHQESEWSDYRATQEATCVGSLLGD